MSFEKIVLVCNPSQPHAAQTAKALADFLHTKKHICTILNDYKKLTPDIKADLCISLGGDGTTLRCARQTAPLQIPVLPINCGSLGFLSACEASDAQAFLTQILDGKYALHPRWLLEADIFRTGQPDVRGALAFNDCVIKASQPRAFTLQAKHNGKFFKQFYGDGVIIATPSGSTAYSLAAGGPIVEPQLDVWTITSICPHSLADRALLLSAQTELTFTPQFKNPIDRAAMSLDGQENFVLQNEDHVTVRRATCQAQLITPPGFDFFNRLHQKLEWGTR